MSKVRILVAMVAVVGFVSLAVAQDKSVSGRDTTKMERGTKVSIVTFRAASETPVPGYDKVSANGTTLYVSPQMLMSSNDIARASSGNDANSIALTLNGQAAPVLVGRVAVYLDGQFIGAPFVSKGAENTITLVGLEPLASARLSRHFSDNPSQPTGAIITLEPREGKVEPGSPVMVDAYITGAVNMRAYQIAVDVAGGEVGNMLVDDVFVEKDRPDWVFFDTQAVAAANRSGARFMGALYQGGVTIPEKKYAGTIVLLPGADARGRFSVSLRQNTFETKVMNPDSINMALAPSNPATIDVEVRTVPVGGRR